MAERGSDRGRVLTAPNVVTVLRLAGVPIFLYLLFGANASGAAVAVLAVGGTTDWVDGYLARRLGQVSRVGELLDPIVDRLYLLATVGALTVIGVVPWAFTTALVLREFVMLGCLGVLHRRGCGPLPVHYVGKTATFLLLGAFPTLLLAWVSEAARPVAGACGWALAWWGIVLYWIAAALYLGQARAALRALRSPAGDEPVGDRPDGESHG